MKTTHLGQLLHSSGDFKATAFPELHDLIEILDHLTHATQLQMDSLSQTIFFLGDGVQRAVTDELFDLTHPSAWAPLNLIQLARKTLQLSTQGSRLLTDNQARRRTFQEIVNKLEVFIQVKNLPWILNLPQGEFLPLRDLLSKAESVRPFFFLWAVEGLGHYYADAVWHWYGRPSGLLLEKNAPVPPRTLLMLHAGMGLSFADRLLGALSSDSADEEIRSVVMEFVDLCRENSRDGYFGAAIESLGLVARDFYPDMVDHLARQLRSVHPGLIGFFWHGVGRALYFSRQYFIPVLGTAWEAMDLEARRDEDRLNAMAGLAWAVTLVNMRQPEIMEGVLQNRPYSDTAPLADAFMNGVTSSMILRADTTPGETFATDFYKYRGCSDAMLGRRWRRYITEPCTTALLRYYPLLQRRRQLDQIFRNQVLEGLIVQLQ